MAETRGPTMLDEERCWQAVCARDAGQDGCFVYGVVTTGVYCRPSCATPRRALRRNVRFFVSSAEAERAGLVARVFADEELIEQATARCRKLAKLAPGALADAKTLLRAPAEDLAARMQREGKLFNERLGSDEFKEAAGAFFERREPDFSKFG